MSTSSQILQGQGAPILLLAYLHREMSHLPEATFHITPILPDRLDVALHHGSRADFTAWRAALGLAAKPTASGASWLTIEGRVADVPVTLNWHASDAEIAAYMAPSPGELAEQRHLVDPLDHVLEHLVDNMPVRQVEDPHDSPLHHTYAVPHDLPEVCSCGHTALAHRPDGCIADAFRSGLLVLCGCTAEVTA